MGNYMADCSKRKRLTCEPNPLSHEPCGWCGEHLASGRELAPVPVRWNGGAIVFAPGPVCACCAAGARQVGEPVIPVVDYATG